MRTILSSLACAIFTTLCYSQSWEHILIDEGVKPVLALDGSGRAHINYMNENGGGWIRYAVGSPENMFDTQTISEGNFEGPAAIAVTPLGVPYIAYHDHDNGGHEQIAQLTESNGWLITTLTHPNHDGWDNSIELDSRGIPHTISIDPISGVEYGTIQDQEWRKIPVIEARADYRFGTTLAIDGNDDPHTVYYVSSNRTLYYGQVVRDLWESEVIDTGRCYYPSLLIDNNETLHLAYYRSLGNGTAAGEVVYATKNEAEEWEYTVVDTLRSVRGESRNVVSITQNQDDQIYIGMCSTDLIKLAHTTAEGWSIDTVLDLSNNTASLVPLINIAIDNTNRIHLAYYRDANNSPRGDVYYAYSRPLADRDNDGFDESVDCNDNDANINPDAEEIPGNNIDENCDGFVLVDLDNDGYFNDEDCNDRNPSINPGQEEVPNNDIDEDCDGITLVIDMDQDGFHSDEDCNDNDRNINPNATEIPNNNEDEDCDGVAQVIDMDQDGFNSDVDCDDNNPNVNPSSIEIFDNSIDEDCDGIAQQTDNSTDITGYIRTPLGMGVPGVTVRYIRRSDTITTQSDDNGQFVIQDAPQIFGGILECQRDTNNANGITNLDVLMMVNHILNKSVIENPLGRQAADVNQDNNITNLDIIETKNVILNKRDDFARSESWRFEPPQFNLSEWNEIDSIIITTYKVGDVDFSADPQR